MPQYFGLDVFVGKKDQIYFLKLLLVMSVLNSMCMETQQTLLEGMLSGKPVIGSPKGALTELVQRRGLLLKKNTAQDLAQAIGQLIQSPELRDRLGQAGPPYAREFSYQAAARAHLSLFEELLGSFANSKG